MYFIRRGMISFTLTEYPEVPFMRIGKGNHFGEIDMVFYQSRKFTAVAEKDVDLLALNIDDYKSLIVHKYSHLATNLRRLATARRVKQIELYDKKLDECRKATKYRGRRAGATYTIKDNEELPALLFVTFISLIPLG